MRPLLIGESNPYGLNPRFALWPNPRYSAGGRLCHDVLRLSIRQYLERFERMNLCSGGEGVPNSWNLALARATVRTLREDQVKILLGAKVCQAFRVPYTPFARLNDGGLIILPHPSGRCRMWNEPASYPMTRSVLKEFLP